MSRFYIPRESIKGNEISVGGKEAHHILNVMRLKMSDRIVTFDGTGKEYIGVIKETRPDFLHIDILETRKPSGEDNVKMTLFQAIPKKEKMDYIVEKAAELGVSAIAPLITGRTIVKWKSEKRLAAVERWRRIVLEASKQCGRVDIPEVKEIRSFEEAIKPVEESALGLVAALTDDAAPIKDAISGFKGKAVTVLIGPEGDFTPDEVREAKKNGFKVINLGKRVLKSDTAGLAVLSILNYEFFN